MSSDIKQTTIVIEGNVQFVGFRSYIEELASRRNLKGFVYNDIHEGNVKLICEGDAPNIKGLIKEIGKNAHVSRIDVKDKILLPKPIGRVVVGIERDTFNRLDLGVEHLGSIDTRLDSIDMHTGSMDITLRENTDILKENTDILKESTDILKENTGIMTENTSLLKDIKEILHKIAEK